MYNPFSLIGKTILVTGASSGIGRGIAIECSKMGASVVITGEDIGRLNDTPDFDTWLTQVVLTVRESHN